MEACLDDPGLVARPRVIFVFHPLPELQDDCCLEVVVVEDILDDLRMEEDILSSSSVPEQPHWDQELIY